MALGFFGSYEHSLDQKGRLILPARFRTELGADGYLTRHNNGCLALWTTSQFEQKMTEKLAVQNRSDRDLNEVRVWAATSSGVEIDRQGRLAVPPALRDWAGLAGTVMVVGAIDRVELWDPTAWDREVRPAESSLMGGASSGDPAPPPASGPGA